MFYKLVNEFAFKADSVSVAFEFILGSFSFLLGYNARIAPSVRNEKYPQNTLQNQLDLIYRTYLKFIFSFSGLSSRFGLQHRKGHNHLLHRDTAVLEGVAIVAYILVGIVVID